ncbi:MAG: SurA N-terminal domain-containing protein, partial [Pseudomonadota bacterium]
MVLDSFRRFGATKAAKFMLFALILAFGAWGIEGFLQAQSSPHGVTVNGQGISLVSLEEDYKRQLQSIEQRLGQPLDAEARVGLNLGAQLVAQAAARTVLRQTAEALHLLPATRTLQTEIASLPPFLNAQGAFDANQYRAALAQLGRTPAQFEAEMAQDLAVRNVGQLVSLAPLPAGLVAQQRAAQNQPITLEMATITLAPFNTKPTEDELKRYYQLNPKTYETPEHRAGEILVLNAAALSASVVIPAERIAAEYEANKAAYSLPETRKVRHILVGSLSSATELQGQIKTAADMARLANAQSIDPGNLKTKGGDLGFIKKADVVPAFGTMAFALPLGTLSAPVQSPFG